MATKLNGASTSSDPSTTSVPDLEQLTYLNLLHSVFGHRLEILNHPESPNTSTNTNPNHALGRLLARLTSLRSLRAHVQFYLSSFLGSHSADLAPLLQQWLKSPLKLSDTEITKIVQTLETSDFEGLKDIKRLRRHFDTPRKSTWIVGSETWARDIGNSALQQALSAGAPVNFLVIDEVEVEEVEGTGERLKEGQKELMNGTEHEVPKTNGVNGHSSSSSSDAGTGTSTSTTPKTKSRKKNAGKKDLGLYAMNYNNAYVGSVAMYGDYAQACRALVEADAFTSSQLITSSTPIGPSLILGLLPSLPSSTPFPSGRLPALTLVRLTQRLTSTPAWPLYRWTPDLLPSSSLPSHPPGENFSLDSPFSKSTLDAFLSRRNNLTLLSSSTPSYTSVTPSYSDSIPISHSARARKAFDLLSNSLSGPPLLIPYASDGGNAEKFAKKIHAAARARGVAAKLVVMDDTTVEDLAKEENLLFVTSTAGQGEFPQNGRDLWKSLQKLPAPGGAGGAPEGGSGSILEKVRFAVFAMGDSHYWPRPEDAGYYNKPGKDLNKRLGELGGERLTEIGLGNDQDADGPTTGWKEFEPRLWKSLGVDSVLVESTEIQEEPISNEHIKISSNFLRGTIAVGLLDKSTGALAESDGQLTKFHGIYQQDDRDIREQRKAEGKEPAYSFMVRVRMAAGVCKPEQWLKVDEISDRRGNGTFKLTTRQTFQFHGIVKGELKPAMQEINKAMLDTIAACGDVNRNVQLGANPGNSAIHQQCYEFAQELSDHHLPKTSAYAEIWLDKKQIAGEAVQDFEPLYGPYYLPRKFKMAIAIPPSNDVDVYTNDLGFIAILEDDPSSTATAGKKLVGFNVSVGGGMGVTHSNKKTYPRLGSVIGFVTREQALKVATAVIEVQRDNGDRTNRKHARLKYTVDDMTVDGFRSAVEASAGFKLAPPREFTFTHNTDTFGWSEPDPLNGTSNFTMFVENGRVADEEGKPFKTGLKELAKVHKGVFRLTANQHLIIGDVKPEERKTVEEVLKKYGMDNLQFGGLRLSSSACVAFPTCGLAMAESERYLPELITKVEAILEENGLRHDSIVMRMTGCPNGCARPWVAEVAFVGKAPGSYLMLLGGGYYGQRLNKIYREAVSEAEILEIMRPLIASYAKERLNEEKFGDFVIRQGHVKAVTEGKAWYD